MTGEETQIRDGLARQRTELANERTLLAYVRTALALLLTGMGLLKFFGTVSATILGWGSLVLGPLVLLIGFWRFLHSRQQIEGFRAGVPRPPSGDRA